jgi:putative redox protein
MADAKPPTTVELIWSEKVRFRATAGTNETVVDGDGVDGPSPVQVAAIGLAGCMGADVAAILEKGRQPLRGLRVVFSGERAVMPPRRFTRITLHFQVSGAVAADAAERAIALSRDTYCSVWHSMRQDIEFLTTFEIRP